MNQKKDELAVVISRADMDMVVKRAGLAALTEEGQSEITRASNETRACVMVTAKGDKVVFDACVSRFASRHIVLAGDGVDIKAEGSACIPVKELRSVASEIPSDCNVGLCYKYQPQESDPSTPEAVRVLQSDGVVEVGAIRGERVFAKNSIDSYPVDNFSKIEYPDIGSLRVIMSCKAEAIKKPCAAISFAIDKKNSNEVLNKTALFDGGDSVYFVGTDSRRCAMVKVDKAGFDKSSDFCSEENGRPIPVLIDSEYLDPILAATADDEIVTLASDEAGEYIYVYCGSSSYRISRLDRALAMKYPDYRRMLALPIGSVIAIDRKDFRVILGMMSKVNSDRAKYVFTNDDRTVKTTGRGFTAIKSSDCVVNYRSLNDTSLKGDIYCLHTSYFLDAVKQMKSDGVKVSFSTDELKLKVEDEADATFMYFMQVMNPNEAV